jgi:hypothetical protein
MVYLQSRQSPPKIRLTGIVDHGSQQATDDPTFVNSMLKKNILNMLFI